MSGGVYSMFGSAAAHLGQQAEAQPGPSASSNTTSADLDWDDMTVGGNDGRCLDLVFIMDATGSMGSYIASATKNIETICENIIQSEKLSGPDAFRVALVAFRDHPPQDHTYITKSFEGFTTDVSRMKENLKTLYASGGGDGPEAVTAALKAALDLDWRPHATKVAVLIADAPPHGIGEYGDGFPNGSPDGYDPLQLARAMAAASIRVFFVACEPALSGYTHAADFYQGIVRITGGQLLPLTTAGLLTHVVIGACGEAMDLERLHREVGDAVLDRLRSMSLEGAPSGAGAAPTEDDIMENVTRELHQSLRLRNERTKQLVVESIYRESDESKHNIEIWCKAPDLATAKPHLKKVIGSRLSDAYLQTRAARSSYQPFTPFSHPRSTAGTGGTASGAAAFSTSPTGAQAGSRRVVSDFSAFAAKPGMSFGGTASPHVAGGGPTFGSPPGSTGASPHLGGAAFSSPRSSGNAYSNRSGGGMDEDDDDDDDEDDEGGAGGSGKKPLPVTVSDDGNTLEVAGEDGQRLAYRQGDISLEQVRRLAQLSAFRGGLT